jgi:hypothetical protein
MKKLLFVIVFLVSSITLSSFCYSQTVTNINGIRYIIEENYALIGRQDKELSGNITIPASINYNDKEYSVTGFVSPTNITSWSDNSSTTEGGAFQSCQITSIKLPSSITQISAGAFNNCSKLSDVSLPDGITSIGDAAFAGCYSLVSLKIPESVTTLSRYTFGGCSNLKEINIPEKVTYLSDGCFKWSGLDSIFIPKSIVYLGENSLEINDLKAVKMGIANLSQLNYSSTTFGDVSTAKLYVPKGSIGVYEQYEPWLNFFSIEEYGESGETFIPDQYNITYQGLKFIIKNEQATIGRQPTNTSGIINIPDHVIYNEKEYPVTGFVSPSDLVCYSDNTIYCKGGAFQNSQIEEITIPNTVSIVEAGAFQGCSNLKKVSLPDNIKQLCAACFAGCYNLESINIPESITDLASYTAYGYRSYVFGGCSSLKSFVVPKSVTRLASGCFKYSGIEEIIIHASCKSLDESSLAANSLKVLKLYIRDLDELKYTESSFGDVTQATLMVPHGSKRVYQEYYPWMNFKNIEEFDDGGSPFVPSKLTVRINDVRYILQGNEATVGRQNKDLSGEIVIPSKIKYDEKEYEVNKIVEPTNLIAWSDNEVTTENGAFQTCPITSVSLPSSITVIPAGAFNNCHDLKEVVMEEGLVQLGAACFAGCNSLVELKIPQTVEKFGSYTNYGFKSYLFGHCSSLKKVNIPSKVTSFTAGCFKGSGLETFIIPDFITLLQKDCFNVGNLKALKITHKDFKNLSYTESIFSDVSNVILYVPEGSKSLYSEYYPWKNFKEIKEYKDQNDEYWFNAYRLTFVVDNDGFSQSPRRSQENSTTIHNKSYIASGVETVVVENPSKEGYIFKGWEGLPDIMPSHDVEVKAIFEVASGIEDIRFNEKDTKDIYTLSGTKIGTSDTTKLQPGIYIINNRKVVIKH